MILRNSFLEAEIDQDNGSIVSLTDKKRKVKFLGNAKYSKLFRIFIPDENEWISQYSDNTDCKVSRIESSDDSQAELFYENIVTVEGKVLDVEVKVNLKLKDDELCLSLNITNNTDLLLHSVRFPWVGGWEVDVDSDTDIARLGTEAPCILRKMKKSPGYNILNKEQRKDAWLHIPTIDVTGAKGGIGLNFYCRKVQTTFGVLSCDTHGWDEQFVSFGFEHNCYLAKGESFTSEPCAVVLTDGDHTKTWDKMKVFLETWWQNPNAPKRLKEAIGYANYNIRDFEGRRFHKISDLPKLCEEARQMGIYDITFWDMMYNVYLRAGDGWFMDDGEEGRVDKFKKYVLQEQAKGMHMSTLVNYRLASSRPKLYKEKLEKLSIKGIYGKYPYESFPIRSDSARWYICEYEEYSHPLCQNEPEFQKFAVDLANEVMDRTGTNALYIDQPFGNNFCFNKEHHHRMGMDDNIGSIEWIKQVRKNMLARDDFSYMMGEVPNIFNTQYIDVWWHWPWNEQGPEAIRYILPDSLQSWVIDAWEHEYEVNKPFSMGMLLCITVRGLNGVCSERPEFMKRIKRLSELKYKTISRIPVEAYVGNRDLKVESDLTVEANLYDVSGKKAIILGDCTRRSKGGEVTLYITDKTLEINSIKVVSEYGNEYQAEFSKEDCGYKLNLTLKPWEAVVILLD